jgi:hypothetical protein
VKSQGLAGGAADAGQERKARYGGKVQVQVQVCFTSVCGQADSHWMWHQAIVLAT